MAEFKCDVCGGKVVSSEREGWFLCESCTTEYPLEWMKAKFQKTQQVQVEGSVQVEGIASVENLYKRATLFLENGDFKQANEYFDKVLDIDAEYAPAYVGKLCADMLVNSENKLIFCDTPIKNNRNYICALRYSLSDVSQELRKKSDVIDELHQKKLQNEKERVMCEIAKRKKHEEAQAEKQRRDKERVMREIAKRKKHEEAQAEKQRRDKLNKAEGLRRQAQINLAKMMQQARQLKDEEDHKRQLQSEKWISEGLCSHCGGKISSFGRKCKSCGKQN